ncbi:MAG: DUF5683 domain-containing protein [Longimicrobiales bacterium]|nr:DUF5683 domain-containing protein [Longimicrobiales bacterium]
MDHKVPLQRASPARRRRTGALLGVFALGALASAASASAQVTPPAAPEDSVASPGSAGIAPLGAFLRAVALPGWGHASIGSYHRGAFYFVTEGAAAWMLLKTRHRYGEVTDRVGFREGLLLADLVAEGLTDEAKIQARLDADPTLKDLKDLQEARRQQREDWTAGGIFLLLLAGVDAYVSAHLRDFPVPLDIAAQPVGNGRVELSVGISLPR